MTPSGNVWVKIACSAYVRIDVSSGVPSSAPQSIDAPVYAAPAS
eukprot:COSAG05_NODE_22086_length_267_cov_0.613095_1_plen_43_part_10